MGPIDYTSQYPQIDLAQKFTSGLQAGATLGELDQQQQARALALQQAQQYKTDAQTALANPTPQAFAALALKYPAQREAVKQSWDGLSAADQKAEGDTMAQAYSALLAGKPDVAKQVVQSQIDARKNSGLDTSHYDSALSLLDADPKQAQGALGFALSHIGDPKDFAAKFGSLQGEQRAQDLAPAAVRKATADAGEAEAGLAQKNFAIVAQKAGALAKPGVKPEQAQTMFRTLAAQGLIPKDDLQGYLDGIPADPKALPDYLASVRDAGIKPDDQKKFITPDANATLQASTSRYATDSAAHTAAARLQFDKDQAKDEPVAPVGTPGLQGQKYLESLDKPTADQVKALAEGRLGFPVGKALQSPYWQKMITAVAQYDPSFDAVNYNARAKTRNDMVAGKSAENIKAINTAIAHMGQLNDQLSGLHNTSSPAYNTVANWLGTHLGNEKLQTKLSAADATAEGVAGEMAKVFRSTGMSEHEIDAWRKKFGNSTTPGQQKGTMQSAMHMLQGRMEAIQEQYKVGMGTTAQPLQILTPEAQVIFDKLIGSKSHAKTAPAAATGNGPAAGTVEGGYRFKGGDPSQPQSWEKL